ncbi:MAG: phytanoyl-CoA dioxygenase family protein [Chloroflexota bacterium]
MEGKMGATAPAGTTESLANTTAELRLTPAQRLHFDVYGFVLLEQVLTPDEVARMKAALYRVRGLSDDEAQRHRIYRRLRGDWHMHAGHLLEFDPALLEFATHPKLLPLVEDAVGGAVRVEETEAIINQRDPSANLDELRARKVNPTGFHTGTRHGWGTYEEQHNFHCLFVKTLAYLTDVGPEDGGTTVIPGSHRLSRPQQEIIAAAMQDPQRLVYQVRARAGSVLLFPESLIHSTTQIMSDTERVILVTGYTPPLLREWPGNEISPEFIASLPEALRPVVSGSDSWHWKRRY